MPSISLPCPKTTTVFGEIFYPGLIVDVRFATGNYQPFEFILDSGADCTMVPRYMATLVGVQIPTTPDTYVTGISGSKMPAYIGQLNLRLQHEEFQVRCLFTKSNKMPFLLGRVDFFSLFDVRFDSRNCHITLEKL